MQNGVFVLTDNPKISIIVPVYKVEPYIRKCLDSIVNQTYRNLQVILIDDGSTDNCGVVCDEYAAKDTRIIVIHQDNCGLSAARNAGLKIANGEYIGFVDSDDCIELDMFEYLLQNAQYYAADIAICGHVECYEKKTVVRSCKQVEMWDTENALKMLLLNGIVQNYVWDKLYKRELFDGIEFPVGKNFEDVAVMYRLFMKSNKIVCLPKAKYNYLQRADSIVNSVKLANHIDHFMAARKRYEIMGSEWPQFCSLLIAQCVGSAIHIWGNYYNNSYEERKLFKQELLKIANFCKKNYKFALQHANLGLAGRLVLKLTPYYCWWSFALSGFVGFLYKLKNNENL